MGNLASQAANSSRMSEFGQANYTIDITMYGLVNCMGDITQEECYTCLQESIGDFQSCCWGKQGGIVLRYGCYLHNEIYNYFVGTVINAPPLPPFLPPVPSPVLRPPPPSNKKDEPREASRSFKLKDLRLATNDFSEAYKLGKGGFGSVYKGLLPNGEEIAVKRLSIGSGQGVSELDNEVIILAQLQHRNLVKLLGFCLEDTEKILVYEYLPNTSLDKLLSDNEKCVQLNWPKRYEIFKGIARGVLYLHEESRIMIIHRDLKTSNILLDETLIPKISDFGLAKLFDLDKSKGTASRIVGTNGYIAPECFMQSYISTKSDVFSYGAIVLEILSGKSVRDFQESGSAPNLLSFVWKKWSEGEALNIIDQRLHGVYKVNEVLRCINITLLCVQQDPSKRPNMATIVLMLSSYSTRLPVPSIPALFVDGNTITLDYAGNSDTRLDSRTNARNRTTPNQPSINDVTITEMDPR
ncbi:hypothetical protein LUZ60_001362 [Juncus effusus]|nr:hypothetical protein LUZ60_001362 [Juncus effusus]